MFGFLLRMVHVIKVDYYTFTLHTYPKNIYSPGRTRVEMQLCKLILSRRNDTVHPLHGEYITCTAISLPGYRKALANNLIALQGNRTRLGTDATYMSTFPVKRSLGEWLWPTRRDNNYTLSTVIHDIHASLTVIMSTIEKEEEALTRKQLETWCTDLTVINSELTRVLITVPN